jgi:hypothetical protein
MPCGGNIEEGTQMSTASPTVKLRNSAAPRSRASESGTKAVLEIAPDVGAEIRDIRDETNV